MESLICIYLYKKVKMKYYLTSLILFFCLISHGQFDIFWDDDPGNIYNGQTINVSKDYGGFDVYMHCQNTSMATQEIKFRRLILSSSVSFSAVQLVFSSSASFQKFNLFSALQLVFSTSASFQHFS